MTTVSVPDSQSNGERANDSPKVHGAERMTESQMLRLKRWNTPTVYNGWEQITAKDIVTDGVNLEPLTDYMPEWGPMVGRAVTVVVQPGERGHSRANPDAWNEYRRYVAATPGPKIVVVRDLDKPAARGAFWGEVNSAIHRALGCVGTITDGAIRDLDEMKNVGFKALARQLIVGHAYSCPVRWGCAVEVFGQTIEPGQLIHCDKHGFLAVPAADEGRLLEAALFMDGNECDTLLAAARGCAGMNNEDMLTRISSACARFDRNVRAKFGRRGEW